jgi:aryl-alcohol dehydrogenase-like predicted oxidoreductase
VVASYVLAGGLLTGKYDVDPSAGRAAGTLDTPASRTALAAARRLRQVADATGTSPAAVAVAFALAHPRVATALLGATSPTQLHQNLAALDVLQRVGGDELRALATSM